MTLGMLLALGAGMGWASLDALRKKLVLHVDPLALTAWLNIGSLAVMLVWVSQAGWVMPGRGYLLPAIGACLSAVGGQLLFLVAVRLSELSRVVPMLAWTPVFSMLMGWAMLGEVPDERSAVGVVMVVAGTWGNARAKGGGPDGLDKGVLAMLGTALLFSMSGVVDKAALGVTSAATHGVINTLNSALLLIAILAVRGRASELWIPPERRLTLAGAMASVAAAYGLQLAALVTIHVGVVEGVKRGLGLPASLVFGRVMFDEQVRPVQGAWVALATVGMLLLTWPR